ncbi:hypothetical protein F506_21980 [Herbaspirillum hiltneri N3]|uniref:DUF2846 domain-containing protein n=1 Tax=Herbaspirillum hiltneri N3 TaxID=1262470 RepID=A0ABM5V5N9_9BURK|nr:DUF2846 domain-containing protein [Herbaspirillum hiltneri]AKZ64969.1 hypothetical protein F506_21980 [Herbaspirillum hiltneri N3]
MTKTIRPLLAITLLAAVLTGCASGPKYAEVADAIPAIKPGQGRIYFMRSTSVFGGALQPEIQLNNHVVGKSQPGGFFFVDRPAGPYRAKTSTETVMALDFSLYPGEVKYVRTEAAFGLLLARIGFSLLDASIAEEELQDLSYTGRPIAPVTPVAPMAPAAAR